MRDIKFRAYVKASGVMREVLGFHYNGKDLWLKYGENNNIMATTEEVEIMQYTGMNDVALNEIYEGDIVELKKGNIVVRGEIVFEFGAFSIAMNEDDMSEVFGFNWNDNIKFLGEFYWEQDYLEENVIESLKIIGNKFENPELLEGN